MAVSPSESQLMSPFLSFCIIEWESWTILTLLSYHFKHSLNNRTNSGLETEFQVHVSGSSYLEGCGKDYRLPSSFGKKIGHWLVMYTLTSIVRSGGMCFVFCHSCSYPMKREHRDIVFSFYIHTTTTLLELNHWWNHRHSFCVFSKWFSFSYIKFLCLCLIYFKTKGNGEKDVWMIHFKHITISDLALLKTWLLVEDKILHYS